MQLRNEIAKLYLKYLMNILQTMKSKWFNISVLQVFLNMAAVFVLSGSCSFGQSHENPVNNDSLLTRKIDRLKQYLLIDYNVVESNYNLACTFALIGEPDSAVFYLKRALDLGYSELCLLVDPDLTMLTELVDWDVIERKVHENWLRLYPDGDIYYALSLVQIKFADQSSRSLLYDAIVNFDRESDEVKKQQIALRISDSVNIAHFNDLVQANGWPEVSKVGQSQMTSVFLVVVHADLDTKRKYLPYIKQSVDRGELPKRDWALFIDKMKKNEGEKQIYGTQLTFNESAGYYELYPVEDELRLNERRIEVGLDSIETYLRRMFEQYNK